MAEKKEHTEHHSSSESFSKKVKPINYWMISTIVLVVILLLALAVSSFAGSGISKSAAEQKIISLAAASSLTLNVTSVQEKSGLYLVNYSIQGQPGQIMLTKDGNFVGQMGPYPVTTPSSASSASSQSNTPTKVPKTDKPTADLYVFAYCPYGTQTEKGLIPVYNLLKSKANISINYIGAMHDPQGCSGTACFEQTETLRQLCIQKIYGTDKLVSYINLFDTSAAIGNCQGAETCTTPIINQIFSSLSIAQNSVSTCMTNDAPAMYSAQEARAQSLGVSGSPTLIVNGVETQSGRSPSALLSTICSGFTTAPAECSQTLDTATPSAGFGGSTGSSTGASCGTPAA